MSFSEMYEAVDDDLTLLGTDIMKSWDVRHRG